ncbi:MAG: MATE family efflux transporter [Spirosomataceae bacterium]
MQVIYRLYRSEIQHTFRLALPIILGQLGIMLMGVADTIQVGHIDVDAKFALDASGIANAVFITIAILGMNALGVIAPMISKAKAQQDVTEVQRLHRASYYVAWLSGLVCGGIILFLSFHIEWFGQNPKVSHLAVPYLWIITISIFPMYLFLAIRQLSDGLSQTRVAMMITLSAVLFNVLFNHLLINGVWLFPKWGLNGAGVATLLARIYMALGIYLYVHKDPVIRHYLKAKKQLTQLWQLTSYIFKIGIPSGFQGFFEVAIFAFVAVMMGWLGENQLAAHMVAISPSSVSYMMVTGIGAAGGIRVGEGLGQRSRSAIIKSGTAALALGFGFMLICGLIFLLGNHWIVLLYIRDEAVMPIAATLVTLAALFQLSDGIQAVALGVLRGVADVNVPTAVTLFAYWGVGLPVGYYLTFVQQMDAIGLWIGLTAGLTAAAVLLTWRFYRRVHQLKL